MADLTLTCPKCRNTNSVPVQADVEEFVCQHCGTKSPVIGDYEALGKTFRDPLIGQSIADWEVVEKVGEGGFGAVYKAIDKNLQRPVAIKVMLQSLSSNLEFVQKFYREAITAAALNHPNIVGIHRVGRDEQRNLNFLVMEFLEGRTLAGILEDRGPFNLEEAVPVVLQCADALAVAHDKNIVHRDIKPENIMMDSQGVVKITDFGLAKTLSSDQKSTKVMGTPHFMSPEQFEGKSVDGRSDIYSLGVTFYFLLTKAKPYKGENTVQIIYSILTQEPQPVTELAPDIPEEVWRIIRKMIAKDLGERYANFRDVRKDLLAFQQATEARKMNCPACRAVNIRGRRFCSQCGASLVVRCAHCGKEEPAGTRHCSGCGANVENLVKIRENMDRGEKLRGLGDLKKALGFYKEVLKIDPEHEAAGAATRAIEASLKQIIQRRTEVDTLVEKGRPDEALAALDRFVAEFPSNDDVASYAKTVRRTIIHRAVDLTVQAAEKARAEGRFEEALKGYRRALETDPERTDIAERLVDLQQRLYAVEETKKTAAAALADGRHEEALRLAREVLEFRPDDAVARDIAENAKHGIESVENYVTEARTLLGAHRFEEAVLRLDTAAEVSPLDTNVKSLRAELDRARKEFEGRITAAREDLAAGRYEAALRTAEGLFGLRPDLPAVVSLKKEAEQRVAEQSFEEETKAILAAARKSEETGNFEGALAEIAEVLARKPESEGVLELKAKVEEKISEVTRLRQEADSRLAADEYVKGLEALRAIAALRPTDTKVQEEVRAVAAKQAEIEKSVSAARRLTAEGRFEEAVTEVDRALALAPRHADAARVRRESVRALNATRKHLAQARHHIESELFEEALRELAKAREAGAREADLAELRNAAEEGRKVLLLAEASRAYNFRDYEGAIRLYGEVLAFAPDDRDAVKGDKVSRKMLRRSERESVLPKVLVSAALVLVLGLVRLSAEAGGAKIVKTVADRRAERTARTEDAALGQLTGQAGPETVPGTDVQPPPPVTPEPPPPPTVDPEEQRRLEEEERKAKESEEFIAALKAAMTLGGFERLTALEACRARAGDDPEKRAKREAAIDEAVRPLGSELAGQAERVLLEGDVFQAAQLFEGLSATLKPDFAQELRLAESRQFALALADALRVEQPEARLTALRSVQASAGSIPALRTPREERLNREIGQTVRAWVEEARAATSWQERAAAYGRILDDESVRATILPDGTPLVRQVEPYREFAEAMGQAEGLSARRQYPQAYDAYEFAASQARVEEDRRTADAGREQVRVAWVEALRAKYVSISSHDSEEFYEQVIRPLAEMARFLKLSPEEAFRQITGN